MNPSQESAPSPEPAQHSGPPADPAGALDAAASRPAGLDAAGLDVGPDPTGNFPSRLDPTATGPSPAAMGGPSFGGAEAKAGEPARGGAGADAGGPSHGGASADAGGPSDGGAEAGTVGPEVYGLAAEGGGYGLAHPIGPEPAAEDGFGARWWGMAAASHRPWKRTALVAVLCAVVVLALGAPLGLLWAWLAPSVPVVDIGDSIVVNDPSPEQYIAADGWYTLLGLGFGLLVAAVAWLLLRRDRGPFLLLGVVAGTLGAGYYIAPWIGEMIGRSGYEHWRDIATRGATYMAPPEVHSTGPKLVSAFAAAIVLTLLAGWSNDPDLDQPGAKPGYGPNAAAAEPYTDTPTPSAAHDALACDAGETLDPQPAHPHGLPEPPRT